MPYFIRYRLQSIGHFPWNVQNTSTFFNSAAHRNFMAQRCVRVTLKKKNTGLKHDL